MSGGGGKSDKVVQSTKPWSAQEPLWRKSFKQLNKLYDKGKLRIDPYPNQTLAGLSPETTESWQMTADRARNGSPLVRSAESYTNDVLAGKYLNADAPGMDTILRKAKDTANANYALGGRYGSGAHDKAIAEATGSILYDNYARERATQDNAARFAPELSHERYYDADRLSQVGQNRQDRAQAVIDDKVNRYNAKRQAPINALALYQQMIGGNLGGTTQTTQPSNRQPTWMQGLGLLGNFLNLF